MADEREQNDATPVARQCLDWLAARVRQTADWAKTHRFQAGVALGASLLAVVTLVALGTVVVLSDWFDQPSDLTAAIHALDAGRYEDARRMAEGLRGQAHPTLETLAGTAMVLGSVAAAEADQMLPDQARGEYLVAAGYLDEARDRGFPPGREAEGLYLLGKSLYEAEEYPRSRPVLREALTRNPTRAGEIQRMLSGTYLNDATPDYAKALEYNSLMLADRTLLPTERHRGLLDRATIFLHLGRFDECHATLDEIPESAGGEAEAMVIRAQVLIHEADALERNTSDTRRAEATAKYQQAVKLLRQAESRDTLVARVSGPATYLTGVCYLKAGEDQAAWSQLDRAKRTYPGTPEEVAANFRLAGLARNLGQDVEALAAYQQVLGSVADPRVFHNRWLTLDDLKRGTLEAYRAYLDADKFHAAVALAKCFYPTFSRTRTLELVGEAYRAWGSKCLAESQRLPPGEAESLAAKGREQFRRAGSVYEHLAELQITTREYPEDLWVSAESYLAGAGYTRAAEMFQKYLKNQSRVRRPRALLGLGEARLALGQWDESLAALKECVDFYPRDAAAFRARLIASKAFAEKGDDAQARRLLEENLRGDLLTPDSAEWRESLFLLGRLLHAEGRHEEAVGRLEEAVTRYPDASESLEARYLVGQCRLAKATQLREELQHDVIPSTRAARAELIRQQLDLALTWFRRARQALLDRQQTVELSPLEQLTLRDCEFAVGRVLFDLGRYEEAVETYLALANRYRQSPPALDAYVQLSHAYQRLGRTEDARRALEKAKAALAKISDDAQFAATTIHSKAQWVELLDELTREES